MSTGYLIYLAVGRLLIFLGAKFIDQNEIKIPFLTRLASCLLCSGIWVYSFLSLATGYRILEDWTIVPVLSEIVTGCVSAYLVYLVEMGWRATHEVIIA